MLSAPILIALGCGKLVTFSHPCADVGAVVAALGEHVGLDLVAEGSVKSDYILVRFDSQPLAIALDRIASTLDATWTERDSVRYLRRTGQQEGRIERYGQEALREAVEEHLAGAVGARTWTREQAKDFLRPYMLSNGTLDVDAAAAALQENGPYRDLLDEFIRTVGAQELARTPLLRYVRYSLRPSDTDKQISQSFRGRANGIALAVQAFAEAMHELGLRTPTGYGHFTADSWTFAAQSHGRSVSVFVTLNSGQPISSLTIDARLPPGFFDAIEGLRLPYKPSPTARSVIETLKESTSFGGEWQTDPLKVDPIALQWFEGGFPVDPLHLLGGEAVEQASEAAGLNIVAVLPDDLATGIAMYRNSGQSLSMHLQSILGSSIVDVKEGWLTAKHSLAPGSRERFDRSAVARYALQSREEGWQRIDPLAELASKCDGRYALWSALTLADAVNPTKSRLRMIADQRFDLLNIYAALPVGAKAQAKQGGIAWNLPEMPEDARRRLIAAVEGGRCVEYGPPAEHEIRWRTDFNWAHPEKKGSSITLPEGTRVEVRLDSARLFATPDPSRNGFYMGGLMSADEVARRIVLFRENPPPTLPDGRKAQGYENLAVVDAEWLLVTVSTPDGKSLEMGLIVDSQGTDTTFHPFDSIPGPEGDALRDALKKIGG